MLTESNALKVMWLYAMQHTAIKTQTAGQHSSNEPAKCQLKTVQASSDGVYCSALCELLHTAEAAAAWQAQ